MALVGREAGVRAEGIFAVCCSTSPASPAAAVKKRAKVTVGPILS